MNTQTRLSASRLILLTLACLFTFGLAACGEDDELAIVEPTVDELLSEETTPVTFNLGSKGNFFLFDYAGSRLVGSDTIEVTENYQKSYTKDLRQGKHRIIWFRELSTISEVKDGDWFFVASPRYDPEKRTVSCFDWDAVLLSHSPLPQYCIKEIAVAPYLLPEQKLNYQPLCAEIHIRLSCNIPIGSPRPELVSHDIPFVKEVGIEDNRCILGKSEDQFFGYNGSSSFGVKITSYTSATLSVDVLCPNDGLDNISFSYEVKDGNNSTVIELPKVSIRRGFVTEITGTLGQSTNEYAVSMREM